MKNQAIRIYFHPSSTKKEILEAINDMAYLLKRNKKVVITSKKIKKANTFFLDFTK